MTSETKRMKGLSVLMLALIGHGAFCQPDLQGGFVNGENRLDFLSDSTMEFRAHLGCCLLIRHYGFGHFKITDSVITVSLSHRENEYSPSYEIIDSLKGIDKIVLRVENKRSEPLAFFNIILRERRSKKIHSSVSASSAGTTTLRKLPPERDWENYEVSISEMGWGEITLPLEEIARKSVKVQLSDHTVMNNGVVFFHIRENNGEASIVGPFSYLEKKRKALERKRKARIIFTVRPSRWKRALGFKHESSPIEFRRL